MSIKSIFVNRKSKVRSGFKIFFVFISIMLFASLIGVIYGIIIGVTKEGNFESIIRTMQSAQSKYFFQCIQELSFIVVPIFSWKLIEKKPLEAMGFVKSKRGFRDFIIGLAFGAVSISLVFFLLTLVGDVSISSSLLNPNFTSEALTGLVLYTAVGLAEETFFRGYCMGNIADTNRKWFAAIVSALLFSMAHAANPNVKPLFFINVFLVGLLFSYMFLKSSNLWLPIGFHAMWDYFEGNVWGFPDSGIVVKGMYRTNIVHSNIINGGLVGPEGGLAVTVIIILGFFFVRSFYKQSSCGE